MCFSYFKSLALSGFQRLVFFEKSTFFLLGAGSRSHLGAGSRLQQQQLGALSSSSARRAHLPQPPGPSASSQPANKPGKKREMGWSGCLELLLLLLRWCSGDGCCLALWAMVHRRELLHLCSVDLKPAEIPFFIQVWEEMLTAVALPGKVSNRWC